MVNAQTLHERSDQRDICSNTNYKYIVEAYLRLAEKLFQGENAILILISITRTMIMIPSPTSLVIFMDANERQSATYLPAFWLEN